jgi:hypothetical protein
MAEVTLATFTPPTTPVVPASGTPDAVPIAAVVCGVLAVYITGLIVFFFVLRLVTKVNCPFLMDNYKQDVCCFAN